MKTKMLIAAWLLALAPFARAAEADGSGVERIYRPARNSRGNTNILRIQPIDDASWVWLPGDDGDQTAFLKFRREFEVAEGDGPLVFDVSADERFYLTLDGRFVARGPNRGTVENWQYQTYRARLAPGRHVFEATVWKIGDNGPLAQLSWRGGFVFKAEGAYDERLTTGKAPWQAGRLRGPEPDGSANGVWGTGSRWKVSGCGAEHAVPDAWTTAEAVRGPAGKEGPHIYGARTPGWMLFPSQLPDQTENRVLPGKVAAATERARWREPHVYSGEEAANPPADLLRSSWTVGPHRKLQLAWDLGRYICAYPEVVLSGGKGARVALDWSESAIDDATKLKGSQPGSRDAIAGRYLDGYGDLFVADGRARGVFTVPWFRCGKWCRISVETGDEPLTVESVALIESRYPLEPEGFFRAPEDPTLAGIRRISERAMQMCCHEMLFDCPYYEQQMYPGDTRVQLNVISAMTRDDRMIKRVLELYDLATRDDGQCPFNWPTRRMQEGATYTLCYLLMHGDYAMNHADLDWLRSRLPGLRKSMSGMELYENGRGLLENLPGWNFIDWADGWRTGVAPDGRVGEGASAPTNLLWLLAMRSAALTERALGNEEVAAYWDRKAAALKAAIVAAFWDAKTGFFADTERKDRFSEHSQCLALLGEVVEGERARELFERMAACDRPEFERCTVYFSYYLFEACFKMGRGDFFLKRLDLWRDYVKKGLTTTQESPDGGKNGQSESRSDCHAWGAHPVWFMQTGLAGIRSDAPGFAKVRIAPCPGGLTRFSVRHPHPQGWIEAELDFSGAATSGTVKTPVAGVFVCPRSGRRIRLAPGTNVLPAP